MIKLTAKPIILVGNGINRISSAGRSWEEILKNLRVLAKSPDCLQGNHKPYTLYFEELYCRARNNGVVHKDFLAGVKAQFTSLAPSEFHKRLMSLDVSHFLTTNYDYTMESSVLGKSPGVNHSDRWDTQESKFSLFRRNKVGRKWIWHIHGEAGVPSSIMLGHDHYVSYAGQMREYWNRAVNYFSTGPIKRAIRRNPQRFEHGPEPYTWLDLFARDNVHICGFGFDFSETVLWYALARRRVLAEHKNKKRRSGGCLMNDVIYHYFFKPNRTDPQLLARLEVLASHGIRCEGHPVTNDDYEEAWRELLGKLEKTIGIKP